VAKRRQRSWARELVETLLLTALIFFGVRAVVQSFRVDGDSMLPSLKTNELLIVNKAVYWHAGDGSPLSALARGESDGSGEHFFFHSPRHGDVIVFRAPADEGRDYIKRVIGVPGDRIEIRDGSVWRNGERLREPYVGGAVTEAEGLEAYCSRVCRVPSDSLFVLGDNRLGSSDSRSWGFVPFDNVIGKAMFTYWPVGELGGVPGMLLLPLLGG
jgi:signal peptidase I